MVDMFCRAPAFSLRGLLQASETFSSDQRAFLARNALLALMALCLVLMGCGAKNSTIVLTIATVNNGDMMIMKSLSPQFEQQNPGIQVKWVVLEENVLRQRVTTDVATNAGQFDVVTVGNYEVPLWAKQGWLKPITDFPPDYDVADLLKPVRDAVTYEDKIYALPFYAESAMTFYRSDLFEAAGLKMPDRLTYDQIDEFAVLLNKPLHQQYGICLRGKPGWGENMAFITMLVHAYGGKWFDSGWHAQIDSTEWHRAIAYYSNLLKRTGPPGAASNGFNENLALFAGGHCAMWIDATVGATLLSASDSGVAGRVSYTSTPVGVDLTAPTWLWTWSLAIPSAGKHTGAALKFASWATSRDYIKLVAKTLGWGSVPPGTRQSTYDAPEYRQAAPYAGFVRNAINTAMPAATGAARPYAGAQFVAIPEFQAIGTQVGQAIAATLTGQATVDAALKDAQSTTERTMRQAGYR